MKNIPKGPGDIQTMDIFKYLKLFIALLHALQHLFNLNIELAKQI